MIDFLGIGAQKAATTWIYRQLSLHPQIRFPAGKEIHFWDRREGRDPAEWVRMFEPSEGGWKRRRIFRSSDPRGKHNRVKQGEITPAYALLDRPTIEQVERCCPEVRIVYSIRNPIERAWSSALMALTRAALEEDEVSDQWFIDHFRSRGSRARGDYTGALGRWSTVFEPEQIHVVFMEDIRTSPRAVLAGLCAHIGVDPGFHDELSDAVVARPERQGRRAPMRPSLVPVLEELYRDEIEAVARMTGRRI